MPPASEFKQTKSSYENKRLKYNDIIYILLEQNKIIIIIFYIGLIK